MLRWAGVAGANERAALRMAVAGDHVGALSSLTSPSIIVASQLGLHHSVLDHAAGWQNTALSSKARRCVALAHAEMGDIDSAMQLVAPNELGWRSANRVRFAVSLGRWAPAPAAHYMPRSATMARAALALHAGAIDAARAILTGSRAAGTADGRALAAALAAARGHHQEARDAAVAMFHTSGLSLPLDTQSSAPLSLQAFEYTEKMPTHAFSVEGPKVSVVMPVRNCAGSIGAAIGSVLRQTWQNLELIVVDDASDDDTAMIVASILSTDPRGRLVQSPAQGGAYAARNTGMALASGEMLTFQDGDDWSHPERIHCGIKPLLADPHLMATQSRLIRLATTGQFVAPRVFPFIRANLSSLMFRRQPVLTALGGFEEVSFGADEEFIGRIGACFGVASIRRIPMLLAVATQAASTLTGSVVTGLASVDGTRRRIAYRESWHQRHIEIWRRGSRIGTRIDVGVMQLQHKADRTWHVSNQGIGNAAKPL